MKNAILVGINDYTHSPLKYCINDTVGLKAVLEQSEYGFDVTTLNDKQATTSEIKSAIIQALKSSDEICIIYFSGHGACTNYGTYLVTSDVVDDPTDGLDLNLLLRIIQAESKSDCAVIVILDCCHSGAMNIGFGDSMIMLDSENLMKYTHTFSSKRALLAACPEDNYSYADDKLQHSDFTYYLLEGLSGDAADGSGNVTISTIFKYLCEVLPRNGIHTPVYRGDMIDDITLGRSVANKNSPAKIDEFIVLEELGSNHLVEMQRAISENYTDRALWKNAGYKTVSQVTTPFYTWFIDQNKRHPTLRSRRRFSEYYQEMLSKIKILYSIEPGTQTEYGIVDSMLGQGAFGTVWKYRDGQRLGAIKVYNMNELQIDEKRSRFIHGYSAMKRLDHPRIVKVHSYYSCPESFTMDYIDGPNLRDWTGAAVELREQIELLRTIADTVQHTHYRGVIHRDIKPENIIMKYNSDTSSWDPYLTDYDLAWYSTATQNTRDAMGTVFYAAPEQLAKPNSAQSRQRQVDIYSFGQIMYYIFTQSDPTPLDLADNKKSLIERLKQKASGDIILRLSNIYGKCTARDPMMRYISFENVLSELYELTVELNSHDPAAVISPDAFERELCYAITGVGNYVQHNDYRSPSGYTSLNVNAGIGKVVIFMKSNKTNIIDNSDFRSARDIMNKRLDDYIRACLSDTYRKSGTDNPYEAIFTIKIVAYSYNEVNRVRDYVVKLLGIMEKG